jgi:aspartyl-tRNA(Asn)/glutamyl-tRNA(Gln) amidotransferase subunit A
MLEISQIISDIIHKNKTSREYVIEALEKAEKLSEYHATLSLIKDRALARADEIDKKVDENKLDELGSLAGVPFLAKDNMLTFGGPTTAASKILENFEAPFQAEAIERLEAAGAICIGKANLDAFAHGSSTENSYYGSSFNPVDKTRVPGGSSGGPAVGVALDIVPFALGTDTGGSIRLPASYCGVYGIKPTYGAVSRYGVVAMASSTDTIGVLAHSPDDVDLVMSIMSGCDGKDSTTLSDFWSNVAHVETSRRGVSTEGQGKLTIGVIREYMGEGVQPEVLRETKKALEGFREMGYEISEVSLDSVRYALAVYYIIVPAELSSNLARYDGIKYGYRSDSFSSLSEVYSRTRSEGFMPENKRRILIGNYVLSSGYYDAYYEKASRVRTLIIRDFEKAFEKCDILVGPVAPTTAFKIGENASDPLQMYLADIMTVPASLAGIPALSVPNGVDDNGLPIGLQLMGPQKSDRLLLNLASQLEDFRNTRDNSGEDK